MFEKCLDDEEKQDQSHPARHKPSTREEQKEHTERDTPKKVHETERQREGGIVEWQHIRKPTVYQIAAVITLKMVANTANPLADIPMERRTCSSCGGIAPAMLLHVTRSTHTVC